MVFGAPALSQVIAATSVMLSGDIGGWMVPLLFPPLSGRGSFEGAMTTRGKFNFGILSLAR